MGVDIYGIDPVYVSKKPLEIDWDNTTKEEKQIYCEAYSKWEKENVGSYFRSNWWCWRPLNVLCLLAQKEYHIPIEIKMWESNDGDGLKSKEDCILLADGLMRFWKDKLQSVLQNEDDKFQLCLGSWVETETGKFVKRYGKLNKSYPEGTILFTPIVTTTGKLVESSHSVPLWMINDWIKFLRNCGGFKIH